MVVFVRFSSLHRILLVGCLSSRFVFNLNASIHSSAPCELVPVFSRKRMQDV